MQVIFVLRELRGSVHFNALTISGVTPVEAHVLNKGAQYAKTFGWSEPFPDGADKKQLLADVEHPDDESTVERWRQIGEVADDVARWRALVEAKADAEEANEEIAGAHVAEPYESQRLMAAIGERARVAGRLEAAWGLLDDAVVEELQRRRERGS